MGDKNVDEIINKWRDDARAAGESAHRGDPADSGRGLLRRAGALRVAAAGIGVLVLGVAALGVLGGGDPEPLTDAAAAGSDVGDAAPAAAPSPEPSAAAVEAGPATPMSPVDEWFALMERVDDSRRSAYLAADPAALQSAFHSDGPALAREEAVVASLAASGRTASGWRTTLLAVSPVQVGAESVRVRVLDQRSAYSTVDVHRETLDVPAAAQAAWLVELRPDAGRWLVYDVQPDVTSPTGQP